MQLHIQHAQSAIPHERLWVREFTAFLTERATQSDPASWLAGGTLTIPLLDSVDDVPLDLHAAIGDRPVLMIFFQGGWSPSCNTALAALEVMLPTIADRSIDVVAVTPELPRHARETVARNGLSFTVAVDHTCRFARNLGLVCKVPVEIRRLMHVEGIRLREWNGEGSYDLPVPTLLFVDGSRRVLSVEWSALATGLDPARVLGAIDSQVIDGPDLRAHRARPCAETRTER